MSKEVIAFEELIEKLIENKLVDPEKLKDELMAIEITEILTRE